MEFQDLENTNYFSFVISLIQCWGACPFFSLASGSFYKGLAAALESPTPAPQYRIIVFLFTFLKSSKNYLKHLVLFSIYVVKKNQNKQSLTTNFISIYFPWNICWSRELHSYSLALDHCLKIITRMKAAALICNPKIDVKFWFRNCN